MEQFQDVLLRVVQWVGLGAVLIAAGSLIFLIVVWKRSGTGSRPASVEAVFIERWKRFVVASWSVAVAASVTLVILEGFVGVEGLRLGLLLLGALAWRFVMSGGGSHAVRGSRLVRRAFAATALVALILSATFTGHARGSSLPLPNLVVATIHVTAAAAWVGGLVALLGMAFPAARRQSESVRAAILAPVVARFSDLAVLSVVAIVASGVYSAWMEIGAVRALTNSSYGLVFLAKLAAFLPVLALGGVNNRWTKPRLVRAVREQGDPKGPLILLRRLVALEVALIGIVLALTVFLLDLAPPAGDPNAL